MIVSLGDRLNYMCKHSETERITWRVNGSLLNVEIFPTDIIQNNLRLPNGSRVSTLTIGGLPEHNVTTIQCAARLMNGSTVVTSNVTFYIEGNILYVSPHLTVCSKIKYIIV